jgi:hypothetical protein
MLSSKEIGYSWVVVLSVVSIIVIFWDYFRGKMWIWRLKEKAPKSRESSNLIPESLCVVQISEKEVSCSSPNGRIENVEWDDLQSVEIVTTVKGPFLPDVFWVLNGLRTRCVIPQGATGEMDLLNRLQKLPGFQNEVGIKAMMSTDNARFLCWKRTPLDR